MKDRRIALLSVMVGVVLLPDRWKLGVEADANGTIGWYLFLGPVFVVLAAEAEE